MMHERTLSTRRVFEGRLIEVEVLEVELENGTRSQREVVRHPGAICILIRRADGHLVFVRQFRKALDAPMLEVVAGTREPGEAAEACARRELREETGYEALRLEPLGPVYPSPGYVSERIEAFYAEVDGAPGDMDPDHDEHLEVVALSPQALRHMIADGGITDAKTLATLYLAGCRRGGDFATGG